MSEKLKVNLSLDEKDSKKIAVVSGSVLIAWAVKKMSWLSFIPAAIGGVFLHQGLKKTAKKVAVKTTVPKPEKTVEKPVKTESVPRKSLSELSKAELYEMAVIRKIPGRSKMNKTELANALAEKQ